MRRGQITVFIILGLVIVIIVGLLIASRQALMGERIGELKGTAALSPELREAGDLIGDCVTMVAGDGLTMLGLHGGYVDNEGLDTFDYAGVDVTYVYYDDENRLPSEEKMVEELAAYIKENARGCISEVPGFEITPAAIKDVEVEIEDEEVNFAVEWPISIKKGTLEEKVDGFTTTLPVRLGTIHDEITGFMTVQLERPDEVCLSCLIDSSQRNDFKVDVNNFITTYVFVVNDKVSALDGEPYKFVFANGY